MFIYNIGMVEKPRVVVAMSGGVDSSVAAALLVEAGYPVIGMMLRLWSEPGTQDSNRCCTPEAMAQARRVASLLNIPFYAVDARDAFHEKVVGPFLEGYTQGLTPNPCAFCNRSVRWGLLLEQARSLEAAFLATGHYARTRRLPSGQLRLLRAVDADKDQTYILHVLNQDRLRQTLFPLGELTKPEVRQIARRYSLPVAERLDSQDLCFLAGGEVKTFLARNRPEALNPGEIIDPTGRLLGEHQGLAFYTIGQRKGLGLSSREPLYVLDKRVETNTLVVGPETALGSQRLIARDVNWISGVPPSSPARLQVKIRYRAQEAWGMLMPLDDCCVEVHFDRPQRSITPGQAAVFYDREVCLGGGTIIKEK